MYATLAKAIEWLTRQVKKLPEADRELSLFGLTAAKAAAEGRQPLVAASCVCGVMHTLVFKGKITAGEIVDLFKIARLPQRPDPAELATVACDFNYEFVCPRCEEPLLAFIKPAWLPASVVSGRFNLVLPMLDAERLCKLGVHVDLVNGVCDSFDMTTQEFTVMFSPSVLPPTLTEEELSLIVGVMRNNGWSLHPTHVDYAAIWKEHNPDRCETANEDYDGEDEDDEEDD